MRKPSICFAAIFLVGAPTSGNAQELDVDGTPFYGTINLRQVFTPDPRSVRVTSGGDINLAEELDNCVGYVSSQPDFRVEFTRRNNSELPLIFTVRANHDTTLLINDPTGEWYCDDDSGGGNRPLVEFSYPEAGTYDVWVGNYNIDEQRPANLRITERR
jgi:hypothetical protein